LAQKNLKIFVATDGLINCSVGKAPWPAIPCHEIVKIPLLRKRLGVSRYVNNVAKVSKNRKFNKSIYEVTLEFWELEIIFCQWPSMKNLAHMSGGETHSLSSETYELLQEGHRAFCEWTSPRSISTIA